MSSEHEESQKALDKFCEKLRKNSKTIKEVSLTGFWFQRPPNHAAQLGPALLNSTVVSKFAINLNLVNSVDDVNPLLPFLRTNQHLRILEMKHSAFRGAVVDDIHETLVGLVLDAASENKGIEELSLQVSEPFESILKCIQGTKPCVLTLQRAFSAANLDRIGKALKVNPRLRSLSLKGAKNAQFLLQHLVPSSQGPPLEILTIEPDYNEAPMSSETLAAEVAAFVTATTTLWQLKLYRFSAETSIEPLVEAFKANQSINDLVLYGDLGKVAAKELSSFLQSSNANTNGIRHLELLGQPLEGGSIKEYMASFLGPCLQSLSLGNVFYTERLLEHLLGTEGVIENRLPRHLHVPYLRFATLGRLAALLPRVVGLKELTLSFQRRQGGRCNPLLLLLPALQQHFGLQRVSLVLDNGEPYYKKETAETKKMKACCTRNAVAPALLTMTTTTDGGPLPGDATSGMTIDGPLRRRVVPSVYVLMTRHESQTAARNTIFKGVFAMDAEVENDDRCDRAKRARLVGRTIANQPSTWLSCNNEV